MTTVARSKQVCIEWVGATVLFCKDCPEGKGDLYNPASRLAFAGDALARLTRDALPASLVTSCPLCSQRPVSRLRQTLPANSNRNAVYSQQQPLSGK